MKSNQIVSVTLIALLCVLSGCESFTDFEPPVIKILSPSSGDIAYGTVEIIVEANDNKKLHHVELYLDEILIKFSKCGSFSFVFNLTETQADTEHTVLAKAFDSQNNWSEAEVKFFGYGKQPSNPVLLSPADGSTVAFMNPFLDWSDVSNAQHYHLQLDDKLDFSSPFVSHLQIENSHYTIKIPLEFNSYYWRVRAKCKWSDWSEWSACQKFEITSYKWKYSADDYIGYAPAIGMNGNVYFGSRDGWLHALDSEGRLLWKYQAGDWLTSHPAIGPDGTIYIISNQKYLNALDPDGILKWKFETNGLMFCHPAIGADGTIYIDSGSGSLCAISSEGKLIWTYGTDSWVAVSPVIGTDGTIYTAVADSYFYAIKPDGKLFWKYHIDEGFNFHSMPAIGADGTVYVYSEANLYIFSPQGKRKGKFDYEGRSPVIGQDGTVFTGTIHFRALNPDGSLKWQKFVFDYPFGSTLSIGSDGTLYGGTYEENMIAYNPDGSIRFIYPTGADVTTSPAIDSHGNIYVGTSNNDFFAMPAFRGGLADSPWPRFRHDNQNTGRAGF